MDSAFERCIGLKTIIIPRKFENRIAGIFRGVNLFSVNITYI